MASFLYRLGRRAYDHRKAFVAGWVAVLALIGSLAGLFMGTLSNTFTLPGTETERVLILLDEELPDLSGAAGSIVFTTADGAAFTAEQKAAIAELLRQLTAMDPIASAADPFDMQAELDDAAAQLADGERAIEENTQLLADGWDALHDGERQLADGEKELEEGAREIEENAALLADGRSQLEAGKSELAAALGELNSASSQLAAGERELEQGRTQLADGERELESGRIQLAEGEKEYEAGLKELEDGEALIAAAREELSAGRAELEAQRPGYERGVAALTGELGVSSLDEVPAAIEAGRAQIEDIFGSVPSKETLLEEIAQLEEAGLEGSPEWIAAQAKLEARGRLDGLSAAEAAYSQLRFFEDSEAALAAGEEELAARAAELEEGRAALDDAAAELDGARDQLASGRSELDAARSQLADGERELAQGRAAYNDGRSQYDAGRAELAEAERTLVDGERQLEEGRLALIDGQQEIDENRVLLEDSRLELLDGEQQLEDAKVELARGQRMSALAQPIRFVSENGSTAIARVQFNGQAEAMTGEERDAITALAEITESAGVQTFFSQEIVSDLNSIFGAGEVIGFAIAGVVLLVMLGTVVAAGLPLVMALTGVAAGVGGTLAFSSLIDMQSITPALALMLGLAVGIDYSLFIVHRHRTQLIAGAPMRESIARAIGTSGNAVVFAGLTVVIALAALVVPGLPFLSILGLSAAFTVFMAVLISITLTPAVLGMIGERLLTKKQRGRREKAVAAAGASGAASRTLPGNGSAASRSASLWWATTLTRRPWLTALAALVFLGVIALPVQSLQTALPDGGSEPYGSDAQQAFEVTSENFGEGFNGPLIVLAELPDVADEAEANDLLLDVAEMVTTTDGVITALPVATNDDLTYGALQVVPTTGPSAPETEAVVHALRDASDEIATATGVETAVTGQVAAQIDVSEVITAALPPYLIIVVGLSLILMLLVFRSVVVPLIATGGFLLSLAAAFGATVAVYQWGWFGSFLDVYNPAPILSFLPILLTGILFGLAMDYQVFLVTAMREAYAHGTRDRLGARQAIREGFDHAAPVVVAAALIMVSVFAGFIFSHLTMIRPLGFGLAIGVLFDAFVVRMTLMPALMHILADKAWYIPKWLDRILPDVDVEGAKLETSTAEPAREPEPATV